ncbi:MAG: DUF2268 domain-containing protein [Pseudomonadota bacterium]|nr:DUF2268 domain-containing protein [Pseudomonadota bacterium]
MSARQAAAVLGLICAAPAHAASPPVAIRTDDVDRFYRVYDTVHGKPTAEVLQSDYLQPGSAGLHQYLASRIHSAAKLQQAIAKWPAAYADARQCEAPLAETKARLPAVFARLTDAYPSARIAPVTFVIGRNDTGGNTTPEGVIIGLETMCRATWMGADVAARFVHIIAHEMVHVQQPAAQVDTPGGTLLFQSLIEGGADFVGELTSGDTINPQLKVWTGGHECAIEREFQKDALGTDLSHWMYNGVGTPDKPGDLGYWVGYRIAKAYYANASDKKQAIADLLNVNNDNAAAFLERSGWRPQTGC